MNRPAPKSSNTTLTIAAFLSICVLGSTAADWSHSVEFPESEKATSLFKGKDFTGWEGRFGEYWSIDNGVIKGANKGIVPSSAYLFTEKSYRNFRLLLETRQTRGKAFSTMHSAVCALGGKFKDKGGPFGFEGPLLMFSNDWGIWDAYRRNRIYPPNHKGGFRPKGAEKIGDWNRIEILVIGNRIRMASNGKLVIDFTDQPKMLKKSPIGLQLHSNKRPQEHRFRGLVLSEDPEDKLLTLQAN
jgi:hypothetical protein